MISLRRRIRPAAFEENPFLRPAEDYAHNLLVGTALRKLEHSALERLEGVDLVLEMAREGMGKTAASEEVEELSRKDLRSSLRNYLSRQGKKPRPPRSAGVPAVENLVLIGSLIGLDDAERAVFQFLLTLHGSLGLKRMTCAFGSVTLAGMASIIAAATNVPRDVVLRILGPKSRLMASGLVTINDSERDMEDKTELKCGILEAVIAPGLDERALLNRFLSEAEPTTLSWEDFIHVREEASLARDLLAKSLENRRHGVNILFYGESGTGKTELARLLAKDIEARLFVAGRADEKGESANSRERLSSLLLGQRLIGTSRALLIFDELEDLFRSEWQGPFSGGSRKVAAMSKQWFNELLEGNQVPTIWVTNSTEGFDRAFLRRFFYAMEFRPLGPKQRARVLERHLGEQRTVTSAEVATMADRYTVSPGLFGSAVAAARLVSSEEGPDRASIERVLAPMEKLITGTDASRRPIFDASSYRLDGINSTTDLEGIADRLTEWKPGSREGISLCLYGPPGTGKSEYVKFLAHRMGRPVLHRRASDILGSYVGQTERQIAGAFREAEENDSVLLFDEADSFLRDRGNAVRSWEVTQVNEFLQQLESFRGVVACTTNLWRDLDEASLRRFVFKIEFRYLRADQAMNLFRSVFFQDPSLPLPEVEEKAISVGLSRLDCLAPGDFAAVARQVRALNRRPTATELLALLEGEVRAKPGTFRAVGF